MAFNLATQGCAMAHCDIRLSDNANMDVPRSRRTRFLFKVDHSGFIISGLGVVSNGTVAVATYAGLPPHLVVYDFRGEELHKDITELNRSAWSGVPMLSTVDPATGRTDIIAADNTKIIRIQDNGDPVATSPPFWPPTVEKSLSISPVFISPDKVITVFDNGTIIVHNVDTLVELARKTFIDPAGNNVVIKNTPCVNGSTIYVLTNIGLKAIDVFVDVDPLKERWNFDLKAAGGASPTFFNNTIFFDGKKEDDKWYVIAVNTNGTEKWSIQVPTRVPASMSQDPRDDLNNPKSIWYFTLGGRLTRVDALTGKVIERLSHRLMDGVPTTPALIAGTPTSPVMVVGAGVCPNAGITAIELQNNANKRLWRVEGVDSFGQLAILKGGIIPRFRVVATELSTGIVYIGE